MSGLLTKPILRHRVRKGAVTLCPLEKSLLSEVERGLAAGSTRLTAWMAEHAENLGRRYSSELARRRDRKTSYEALRTMERK